APRHCGHDQERGREHQPADRPRQDERRSPVCVLKEQQAADDRRTDRAQRTRIEDDRRWNRQRGAQTSSSSASSARSMMKRKRADAPFPISSLIPPPRPIYSLPPPPAP